MGNFRTFQQASRQPAHPLQPVVDPAGWTADSMKNVEEWSYRLTEADCAELRAGIQAFRLTQKSLVDIAKDDFPLDHFGKILRDASEELRNGRGIVMLRGFPVGQLNREETAIAFMGLGSHLGQPMSQNKFGHVLGHVTDLGGSYSDTSTRGYMTRDEMRFHSDRCDFVGLLCLQTAKSGGESRVVSSISIYNRILEQNPNLAKALCEDFYRSRSSEVNKGEENWSKQSVFWFHDGYFGAVGAGAAIDKAQRLAGVPKFTEDQREALALYRKLADELAADIPFEVGDIQFLNNFVMLHTRRAYEDWPEPDRKRHLLRLWLANPKNRPIPEKYRSGRTGQGVHLNGVTLSAPLTVDRG